MADVQPLRALRYDQERAGPLQDLVSPPYDVIDDVQRAELVSRSPYNVVNIDLPRADGDPYAAAAGLLARWRDDGAVVRDEQPALWALTQDYDGPDGQRLTRRGFLCRVRVEEYGAGRVRPHERTHPGPKEDRLRLTGRREANLSPIFALHSDPPGAAWSALQAGIDGAPPWGEVTDDDGTLHRLWRVEDPRTAETVHDALAEAELLIADGHHRYETARVYAEEVGGEGPHRYVLVLPGRARGSGAHGVPHPPPRARAHIRPARGARAGDPPRLRDRGGRAARRSRRRRRAAVRSSSATSTPTSAAPSACACATSGSPTRRSPTTPRPTAGWTPPCSRRCC